MTYIDFIKVNGTQVSSSFSVKPVSYPTADGSKTATGDPFTSSFAPTSFDLVNNRVYKVDLTTTDNRVTSEWFISSSNSLVTASAGIVTHYRGKTVGSYSTGALCFVTVDLEKHNHVNVANKWVKFQPVNDNVGFNGSLVCRNTIEGVTDSTGLYSVYLVPQDYYFSCQGDYRNDGEKPNTPIIVHIPNSASVNVNLTFGTTVNISDRIDEKNYALVGYTAEVSDARYLSNAYTISSSVSSSWASSSLNSQTASFATTATTAANSTNASTASTSLTASSLQPIDTTDFNWERIIRVTSIESSKLGTGGAQGAQSIAFGFDAETHSDYSIAIGDDAIVNPNSDNGAAFGNSVVADGYASFAQGDSAGTNGHCAIAMGFSNFALADNAVAMGTNTIVTGTGSYLFNADNTDGGPIITNTIDNSYKVNAPGGIFLTGSTVVSGSLIVTNDVTASKVHIGSASLVPFGIGNAGLGIVANGATANLNLSITLGAANDVNANGGQVTIVAGTGTTGGDVNINAGVGSVTNGTINLNSVVSASNTIHGNVIGNLTGNADTATLSSTASIANTASYLNGNATGSLAQFNSIRVGNPNVAGVVSLKDIVNDNFILFSTGDNSIQIGANTLTVTDGASNSVFQLYDVVNDTFRTIQAEDGGLSIPPTDEFDVQGDMSCGQTFTSNGTINFVTATGTSITASLKGTSSFSNTASFAVTASKAISSSFANTASYVFGTVTSAVSASYFSGSQVTASAVNTKFISNNSASLLFTGSTVKLIATPTMPDNFIWGYEDAGTPANNFYVTSKVFHPDVSRWGFSPCDVNGVTDFSWGFEFTQNGYTLLQGKDNLGAYQIDPSGNLTMFGPSATINADSTYIAGDLEVGGKISGDGGIDPPYVLYDRNTREAVKARVLNEVTQSKQGGAALFFNQDTHRLETYVASEDKYFDMMGTEII